MTETTPNAGNNGLRLLLPYARHGRGSYIAAALLATLGTLCQLAPFWLIYRTIDDIVSDTATERDLLELALLALIFIAVGYLLLAAAIWLSHRAAFATLEQVRLRIGDRIGRVPLGFLSKRRSGEIQRTMSDDVERLELFLAHALPDLVAAVVVVGITTIWMFVVDWRMAIAAIAAILVAIPLMGVAMRRGQSKMGQYIGSLARMNGSIVEYIRGLPVVRAFSRRGEAFSQTRQAIEDSAEFQAQWGREFLPTFTAFSTLIVANIATIVPVGLWLLTSERIDVSEFLFFLIIGLGYSAPVLKLLELMSMGNYLTLAATMVEQLDRAKELPEVDRRAELGSPAVEFRAVDFSYDERRVLEDITFTASPGTVTALVGPSGSGKSTVAKLICRFWDVDAGSVSVGGVDVRAQPFAQLMDQVAFVFQETFLFDDTVAANLRIGRPDATDAELDAAARAAQAHDFITALPDGYDTELGERGARLSGGERQRLAIARAILKDAPVIVLDEATAFADPENEAALQDAIGGLVAGRTLVIIAHRLSTIVGADQILVLDAESGHPGRIVERGRHAGLVAAGGLYARLWQAFQAAEQVELGRAVHGEGATGTAPGTAVRPTAQKPSGAST